MKKEKLGEWEIKCTREMPYEVEAASGPGYGLVIWIWSEISQAQVIYHCTDSVSWLGQMEDLQTFQRIPDGRAGQLLGRSSCYQLRAMGLAWKRLWDQPETLLFSAFPVTRRFVQGWGGIWAPKSWCLRHCWGVEGLGWTWGEAAGLVVSEVWRLRY